MKNIFVFLFSLFLFSCAKNETDQHSNTNRPPIGSIRLPNGYSDSIDNFKARFIAKIESRNNKLGTNRATSWWGSLVDAATKIVIVAGSDAIGAGAGIAAGKELIGAAAITTGGTGAAVVLSVLGGVGGTVASVGAYNQIKSANSITPTPVSPLSPWDSVKFVTGTLAHEEFYKVGYYHNHYLDKIMNDVDESFVLYGTLDNWLPDVVDSQYHDSVNLVYNTLAFRNKLDTITYFTNSWVALTYHNPVDLLTHYYNTGYFSYWTAYYINEYVSLLISVETPADLQWLSDFFMHQISYSSILTTDELNVLVGTFSTIVSSMQYWHR